MKKKIIAVLLLAALLPLALLLTGALLPEYYGESYYAELSAMYEKLKSAEGKKIVIVGGSNVAFGVDSVQLEQTLRGCGYDYTVCNFGLYAAVGTSVMLELSEDLLGEGDVVVLAIEPTSETFSTYFGATAFWKCAEEEPAMLLHLSKSKSAAMVGNYVGYLQERVQIRSSGILPAAEGVYARASFDENCDMVYDRAGNAMLLGYDTGSPIDLAAVEFSGDFCSQVEDYCEAARRRGAEVVMSFSPMNRGALTDGSEEAVYGFFRRLMEAFPCPIISDPNDYIMESPWFYDSNFHLNTPGASIRTHTLACDLLNYLGCYREVFFAMPEMPDSIAQLPTGEVDTGDFLFTPLGESGYIVSGLTEAGRGKSALMVPSAYQGKPVVGMTADTFSGNLLLTELTLPETVEFIPDGAFYGCENLTRLTLLHKTATPSIGEAPFEGTRDLKIYVPSAAYSLYRDGAGCEANPWEAYLSMLVPY